MYDVNGNLIDDQDIVYGNLNGTNYSETTSTGAAGVVNNTTDQWGNNSSAFVSFSSSVAIGEVFLFVGDDDENDTGSSEHLSISGLKFAAAVPEPSGFLFLGLIGLISAGFRRWNNK